ncbi:MAG TPA: hypothetical protein VM074_11675 [Solimonas sp.]|nr:hypothetical protein [Solimonas sp.]
MNSTSTRWLVPVMLAATAALTACLGDNDGDLFGIANIAPLPPPATAAVIEGVAELGPITGATIQLFPIAADGSSVQPGFTAAATGTPGGFKFTLPALPAGPFRVCVTGGTYTDEATGATVTNTLTGLCAAVPGGTNRVNVNIPTALIDALLRGALVRLQHAASAQELNNALNDARDKIVAFTGLTEAPHRVRARFTPPDPANDPGGDGYRMGALLGAYSQLERRNAVRCGAAGPRQDRLQALLSDIGDGAFDGKRIDPANVTNRINVLVPCGAVTENLPVGTGTAELLNAFDEFANTPLGNQMQLLAQTGLRNNLRTNVATGPLAPPQITGVASQGLVAVDTARNIAYAPVYTLDAQLNAQVAVVNLDPGAANPIITTISLPGSNQPIASSMDAINNRVFVAARQSNDNSVRVYRINPATNTLIDTMLIAGLTHSGNFGGIVANPSRNKVIVVGTAQLAILDISVEPPVLRPNSVIPLFGTDSIALNFDTELLFNSSDGSNQLVDTAADPPTTQNFISGFGTTDGVAFDNLTNICILDPEFVDQTTVFNFNALDLLANPASAPNVTIPGLGATPIDGEGPGGQAAINVLLHQGVVADEFGENFKLLQLPTTSIATGAPNLNGQPGSGTTADASSAFQIAAAVLPKADLSGEGGSAATQLTMRGDPNSLSVDPIHNVMLGLVDTATGFNSWPIGSNRPLFLVVADLSAPVLGASPTATNPDNTPLRWNPVSRLIRLP